VPGVNNVKELPKRSFPTPVFIRHSTGVEQRLELSLERGTAPESMPVTVVGPDGKELPQECLTYDPAWAKVGLTVPSSAPSGVYVIRKQGGGRINIAFEPGTPLKSAIEEGIDFGRAEPDRLWFNVPGSVKSFRVRGNVDCRRVVVTRPDGNQSESKGFWNKFDVPSGLPEGPWSVQVDAEPKHHYQIVKLYDVPAVVAFERDSVFAAPNPPMPTPDYQGEADDSVFVAGQKGFETALHINRMDKLLVPLGEKVGPRRRERFLSDRGSIEFFFKLNENPRFTRGFGIPFGVPMDDPKAFPTYWGRIINMDYKNSILFSLPRGKDAIEVTAGFGPWNAPPGMIYLEPGIWYHLALVWDCNKRIETGAGPRNKFAHRAFLNGKPISNTPQEPTIPFANSFPKDGFVPPPPGEMLEFISKRHDIIIDELRVSDIMRGDLDEPFPVPIKPYVHDEHSLLLMHFDGSFKAVGAEAEAFEAAFTDKE